MVCLICVRKQQHRVLFLQNAYLCVCPSTLSLPSFFLFLLAIFISLLIKARRVATRFNKFHIFHLQPQREVNKILGPRVQNSREKNSEWETINRGLENGSSWEGEQTFFRELEEGQFLEGRGGDFCIEMGENTTEIFIFFKRSYLLI